LLVLSAVIFYRPLALVVESSLVAEQYSQVLIVLPVSAALLWLGQRRIFVKPAYSPVGGVLFALFAGVYLYIALTRVVQDASIQVSLSILLFSACCVASFLACYGVAALRAGLFPWCFLVLMTPLPDAARNRVITFLQNGSAVMTDWLFSAAQIPFSRDGVVLALPTVTIEIAQECSGIRSSVVLFLVGLVLGHMFLKHGWTKAVLVVFLVPLTIVKNAVRIFTLSTLGMYVDRSFLTGPLHHQGGFVFFAVALAGLWAGIWCLQKLENRLEKRETPLSPSSETTGDPRSC
jgi:exosortase